MLEGIAWERPWLAPYRERGLRVAAQVLRGSSVAEALNAQACGLDLPLFVPQAELPDGQAYEAFIFDTGRVPTRDNLHDFFNGLVWLHQPALKRRLNALQAAEIAAQGSVSQRGAARDALTLFDENAALLHAPEPLLDALWQRDWQRLFVQLRPLWAQASLQLFGHALLEKLVQPRKPITAHVWIDGGARPDAKPYAPLPVLGVPGWWAGNEALGFYADAAVFRPPRVL
ncbi:MAG: DUF3025 domain-containing protein [Burkholderiaceae bacterium]|nr:DUF3025 domain-containing protein [Burkholderiaceae bacterium]